MPPYVTPMLWRPTLFLLALLATLATIHLSVSITLFLMGPDWYTRL
jgi:hypothetical protein